MIRQKWHIENFGKLRESFLIDYLDSLEDGKSTNMSSKAYVEIMSIKLTILKWNDGGYKGYYVGVNMVNFNLIMNY